MGLSRCNNQPMPDFKMMPVHPPTEPMTIIALQGIPGIVGHSEFNYYCGRCDAKLLENVALGFCKWLLLKCPSCSTYNNVDVISYRGERPASFKNARIRKIRCTRCVHLNLIFAVTENIATLEFCADSILVTPIDAQKHIYDIECTKCKNHDVCILPI